MLFYKTRELQWAGHSLFDFGTQRLRKKLGGQCGRQFYNLGNISKIKGSADVSVGGGKFSPTAHINN